MAKNTGTNAQTMFENLTKDMSKGVKRVVNNFKVLEELSYDELTQLKTRTENYSPKNQDMAGVKSTALNHITAAINKAVQENTPDTLVDLGQKVKARARVLRCNVRQMGFIRKVDAAKIVQTNGENKTLDPSKVHAGQEIIDVNHPTIKRLRDARSRFINYLKGISVPDAMPNGMYLILKKHEDEFETTLEEFNQERTEILNEVESLWETLKQEAKVFRGAAYRDADYPEFSEVRGKFYVDWRYVDWGVPQDLKRENLRRYEQQVQKDLAEWAATAQNVQDAMRIEMQNLINHLVDKLSPGEDGKRKVFHGSNLENLREFIKSFEDKNLTGDVELANLAKQAQEVLEGVDLKKLKKDEDYRDTLKTNFEAVKTIADKMVVVRSRKFDFSALGED